MEKRNYDEAVAEAGKVLKFDENHLEGLLVRGKGYYYLGDHDLALRCFSTTGTFRFLTIKFLLTPSLFSTSKALPKGLEI